MMINSVVLSGKKNVSKDSEFLLWGWQMGHQTDVYGELIREQEGITSPPPCVFEQLDNIVSAHEPSIPTHSELVQKMWSQIIMIIFISTPFKYST